MFDILCCTEVELKNAHYLAIRLNYGQSLESVEGDLCGCYLKDLVEKVV